MKKIRLFEYILSGLAVICILAMLTLYLSRNKELMKAFFGITETMAENICFVLAPALFGTAALLGFIEKCRDGGKHKALMLCGTILCYLMVVLIIALCGTKIGSPLKKFKSPDNKHTLYYMDYTTDEGNEKRVFFVRKNIIEYDPVFGMRDKDTDNIEWEDDYFLYHGWRYKYSEYEK